MNIVYSLAWRYSNFIRLIYKLTLPCTVKRSIVQSKRINIIVYSLSCERDLPEQVANIRSFIRYVGTPDKFIVVSDGTHSPRSRQLLRSIHYCIDVVDWQEVIKNDLPPYVYTFAKHHFFGKKLAILMSMPVKQPAIYTDSDVLFFPAVEELIVLIASKEERPRFLLDCLCSFDERLLLNDNEKLNPANAGFILFKKPLEWENAVRRLEHFKGDFMFHTEQTIVHLALQENKGLPFNPDKFILRLDDQFVCKDKYASANIALRHYTNPVRYKLWFNLGIF